MVLCRARMRESDANRAIEAHRRGERSQWELDPDKVIVGDRIAVGGFAEVLLLSFLEFWSRP